MGGRAPIGVVMAEDRGSERLDDEHKTAGSSVPHTVVCQGIELGVGGEEGRVGHFGEIVDARGSISGCVTCTRGARNGVRDSEDGSVHRVSDRTVGAVSALDTCCGHPRLGVTMGESVEPLRKNGSGVPSGAVHRSAGNF